MTSTGEPSAKREGTSEADTLPSVSARTCMSWTCLTTPPLSAAEFKARVAELEQ